MKEHNKTIVLGLVVLGLPISSVVLSYYLLNLLTWSWAIGGLVMTSCLLAFLYLKRRVVRHDLARGGGTDDKGFQKKERVFNQTISRPAAGPLWESRIYNLDRGDMLKVEVSGDREVTARLVKIGPGSIKKDVDGPHGPSKRWSNIFEIKEEGDHQVVLDSVHQKVTLTVKIGIRANRPKDAQVIDH